MRSSATSTRLTPLKLKSSSTRYAGGSAETCRTIVPRASCTFWLNPTPWIVSPLRFTLTRWFGSSTSEPPQEHFDLLLGLEIAGSLSHLQPLPVRGPRLVGPARPLEGAAEAAVRGSVVRFEPDRLPILGDPVIDRICLSMAEACGLPATAGARREGSRSIRSVAASASWAAGSSVWAWRGPGASRTTASATKIRIRLY